MTKCKYIFICSPYAGDTQANVRTALRYGRLAALLGHPFVITHAYMPNCLDDKTERELGMSLGNQLLEGCDEVWVCGDVLSDGMRAELTFAIARGIPIRFKTAKDILDIRLKDDVSMSFPSTQAVSKIYDAPFCDNCKTFHRQEVQCPFSIYSSHLKLPPQQVVNKAYATHKEPNYSLDYCKVHDLYGCCNKQSEG